MKILVCGGGTGGHIYPALAVVAELRQMGLVTEDILWIGTRGEIEESLVPRAGIQLETIVGGAIVGVPWRVRLNNALGLTRSIRRAMRIMGDFRPNVLLMTGGYVNAPVAQAAWLRRIPAAIYLPDIEPGLAIRSLSRLAKRIACTAEASRTFFRPGKTVVTGYPVRPELRAAAKMSRKEALSQFDLEIGRPTLLVTGGSRGARSINRALMAILPQLLAEVQIVHLSGSLDWPEVDTQAKALPSNLRDYYRPFPYLHEEMGAAFRAADLVLARAGASMLGECPAFGLPAVLVPYPYAWRYQKVNADYLVERGAALRLDDDKMPGMLLPTLLSLLQDEVQLKAMSEAAASMNVPDSAYRLARLLLDLAEGNIT